MTDREPTPNKSTQEFDTPGFMSEGEPERGIRATLTTAWHELVHTVLDKEGALPDMEPVRYAGRAQRQEEEVTPNMSHRLGALAAVTAVCVVVVIGGAAEVFGGPDHKGRSASSAPNKALPYTVTSKLSDHMLRPAAETTKHHQARTAKLGHVATHDKPDLRKTKKKSEKSKLPVKVISSHVTQAATPTAPGPDTTATEANVGALTTRPKSKASAHHPATENNAPARRPKASPASNSSEQDPTSAPVLSGNGNTIEPGPGGTIECVNHDEIEWPQAPGGSSPLDLHVYCSE